MKQEENNIIDWYPDWMPKEAIEYFKSQKPIYSKVFISEYDCREPSKKEYSDLVTIYNTQQHNDI